MSYIVTLKNGEEVNVDGPNVGVSNGCLYVMSGNGNVAVFAREEWTRAVRRG